jgi:anaerobic selenocysteine-containing dehydrogenase
MESNLVGSVLMGITPAADSRELDVLYLVGERIPTALSGAPFIVYQNIYPPDTGLPADLLLPAAAFSETDGTLIDHAGRVRPLHAAVMPPGAALPTWQILCRIASALGAPGFDFINAAAVSLEIAAQFNGFQVNERVNLEALPGQKLLFTRAAGSLESYPGPEGAPRYMGFSLSQWVAGLKQLYPSAAGQAGAAGQAPGDTLAFEEKVA